METKTIELMFASALLDPVLRPRYSYQTCGVFKTPARISADDEVYDDKDSSGSVRPFAY